MDEKQREGGADLCKDSRYLGWRYFRMALDTKANGPHMILLNHREALEMEEPPNENPGSSHKTTVKARVLLCPPHFVVSQTSARSSP